MGILDTPEKKTIQKFEQLRYQAAQARLPFDKDAWLNVAFYLDKQYVEWSADSTSIREIPRREGFENTPRPVANKIMHFVAQEHAMALKTRPTVDVLPTSDDPIDSSDAAVSLAYLRWLASESICNFDAVLSEATHWALLVEGFIKWTFNQKKGHGDICAVSPLDLYFDPYCKEFRNARYAIHTQFMDPEQVYDLYGVEVPAGTASNLDSSRASFLRDMGAAPVLSGVQVNELWYRPCRRYPDGLFAVWAGTKFLVEPTDFPYDHGRLPFTQLGTVPRPGSPHYTSAVTFLRNPQMELNKYHAQRIMTREVFASPKWWVPLELELEHDPDDSPNQILRGTSASGLSPQIIQPTSMANGTEGDWIANEMMNVVGLHEVSQAQVPGRVESSKAIESLKEADDSRLAELLRTTKASISEGFWQELQLARQFVKDELVVSTYSREGLAEVKRFKADVVNPGQHVQVTMQTGLSSSRAARTEQVMLLVQNQIIRDPEIAAELLDIPVGQISPNKGFDIRCARNENLSMADGVAIVPNSWDDHAIHLREHNNFRKTSEFHSLSEDTKNKWEMHCETHDKLQQSELQKQAQLMALAQPQPTPGGGAPQPAPADTESGE